LGKNNLNIHSSNNLNENSVNEILKSNNYDENIKKLLNSIITFNSLCSSFISLIPTAFISKMYSSDIDHESIPDPKIIYRLLASKNESEVVLQNDGIYIERILCKRCGNVVIYENSDEYSNEVVFGIGDYGFTYCERVTIYLGEYIYGKITHPEYELFRLRILIHNSKVQYIIGKDGSQH